MSNPEPSWWKMFACQPPLDDIYFLELEPSGNEIQRVRNGGMLLVDAICITPGYQTTPEGFNSMTPVTFAKDVVRTNYKKGELKFEECELDLW